MALIDQDGQVVNGSTMWRATNLLRERASREQLLDPEYVAVKMQEYVLSCEDEERPMSLHDMIGFVGFASLPHMLRMAVETGGQLAWVVARGLNAIGATYEEMTMRGHKQTIRLLERLPQIDPDAAMGPQISVPMSPKVELEVSAGRNQQALLEGRKLVGSEAYMAIVKHRSLEEAEQSLDSQGVRIVENEDGTREIDFGGGDE